MNDGIARVSMLTLMLLLLAACTTTPKKTPPPAQVPVQTKPVPVVKPAPVPLPVPASLPPVTGTVEPSAYQQHKIRIKQGLSKSTSDSLSGKDVGYYLDVLQGRLRQTVGKYPSVGMARNGEYIVLMLSGRDGFEPGSNQLSPGAKAALGSLSKLLAEYRMMLITVRIHPDGVKDINAVSTEQRAQTVARYLNEAGVASKRLIVVAPTVSATGTVSGGRARIELQLEPVVRAAAQP